MRAIAGAESIQRISDLADVCICGRLFGAIEAYPSRRAAWFPPFPEIVALRPYDRRQVTHARPEDNPVKERRDRGPVTVRSGRLFRGESAGTILLALFDRAAGPETVDPDAKMPVRSGVIGD